MSRVIGQYPDVNWLIDKWVGSESYKTACSKTYLRVNQMRVVLSSQQLPENASMEIIGRAYHATETFVQGILYAKSQLRKLYGGMHYTKDRFKFKHALQLYKDDPAPIIQDIINTIEGGPPTDVSYVCSMYEHLDKSAVVFELCRFYDSSQEESHFCKKIDNKRELLPIAGSLSRGCPDRAEAAA
ncbi:hypothetical protein L6452_43451 [Arctium lappa]|uniref:Uncharacterized protein n=1 Tax=Arctium lappa TaxID=4217 RepID=A0ACB8XDS3_ARCLA|nr:hypothetical protein L6452_43451 [Arctium lappa]